jgi:hypothetical protein
MGATGTADRTLQIISGAAFEIVEEFFVVSLAH